MKRLKMRERSIMKNLFIRKKQTNFYIFEKFTQALKEKKNYLLLLRKLRSAVIIKITGVDKVENSQMLYEKCYSVISLPPTAVCNILKENRKKGKKKLVV